jgi:hypothetical protein
VAVPSSYSPDARPVFPAHTRLEVIRAAEPPPRVAAKLTALIRMNQGTARPASPHLNQDGIEHELAVNRRLAAQPTIRRENRSITTAR